MAAIRKQISEKSRETQAQSCENADKRALSLLRLLFLRLGGKTAGFQVVGFRIVGLQGAGLFVLAAAVETSVSAVCIVRSRFVCQIGLVRVCRNGYVRGFSGAALLVARVQVPPQFPDGLVALIRGESAGFHNDRL